MGSHRTDGGGRIAYADLDTDPLVATLDAAAVAAHDASAAGRLGVALYQLDAPLPFALAERVLRSTGPFARLAARGLPADDPRRARAADELTELGRLARMDVVRHLASHGIEAVAGGGGTAREHWPPRAKALRARLAEADDWGRLIDDVADLAGSDGIGDLACHRVLRWQADALVGVAAPDPISIEDLVGGESQRAALAEALASLVRGGPPIDALLYGPPGTGKSSAVRALAAAQADAGLRLIQLERRDIGSLRALFGRVSGGPPCLVLVDDLVFDEGERSDRELRGVLEGDVGERPGNVAVWATSNRMRLIHETRQERESDLEGELGRGERSALATRFGLRVAFPTIPIDEFVRVATVLVTRRAGEVGGDVASAARRFAVDRGQTPRAARQFADLVAAGVIALPA